MTVKTEALPKGYQPWWREISGHLGAIYPFQDQAAPTSCAMDIDVVIAARRARGEKVRMDAAALVAKAMNLYLYGNRTLIREVTRAPWMAYPDANGNWLPAWLPPHSSERPEPEPFVEGLKHALLDECRLYVRNAKTVGILLSGGMDSRILAGVVRAVQDESGDAFSVVGLTWGLESSRDVIYARRITERFGWDWQHYSITAETLAENIEIAAREGAEYSPLHLHAIPEVARTDGLDVVLAGSYGDSVGRAEFSGRHVTQLRPMLSGRMDRFGVLRAEVVAAAEAELRSDIVDSPFFDEQASAIRSLRD